MEKNKEYLIEYIMQLRISDLIKNNKKLSNTAVKKSKF